VQGARAHSHEKVLLHTYGDDRNDLDCGDNEDATDYDNNNNDDDDNNHTDANGIVPAIEGTTAYGKLLHHLTQLFNLY
jgi:hypothetical protein